MADRWVDGPPAPEDLDYRAEDEWIAPTLRQLGLRTGRGPDACPRGKMQTPEGRHPAYLHGLPQGGTPIRVLIVDDHFSLAESLAMAIDFEADMECIGIAPTSRQALELVAERAPDAVLMDVRLPDSDGIEATARVKAIRPEAAVIVLTAHPDPAIMVRAGHAGASGFLRKESRVAEILRAIRLAKGGELALEPAMLRALLGEIGRGGRRHPEARWDLTPREREVLTLLGEGLGPKAIARELGITVQTCRGYVKSVLGKLGAHSQLEAVVVATREGLLPGVSD